LSASISLLAVSILYSVMGWEMKLSESRKKRKLPNKRKYTKRIYSQWTTLEEQICFRQVF